MTLEGAGLVDDYRSGPASSAPFPPAEAAAALPDRPSAGTPPPAAHGLPRRGARGVPAASMSAGKFGMMFPGLPRLELNEQRAAQIATTMAEPAMAATGWNTGGAPVEGDNPDISAGYTYIGQFLDHDITFDPSSSLTEQNDKDALRNSSGQRLCGRTPARSGPTVPAGLPPTDEATLTACLVDGWRMTVTGSKQNEPRKQHTVSKVVLRQFVDASGQLERLDVRHAGARWRRASPAASGYVESFVRANALQVEQEWQKVEELLRDALAELDNGRVIKPGSPTEAAIKDCLALHWARSRPVRATSERAYEQVREASMRQLEQQPDLLDEGFREVTGGLHPAGPEARRIANERLHSGPPEITSGRYFAARVVEFHHHARSVLADLHLQVGDCADDAPDLVISDSPVITPDKDVAGLNPFTGVALGAARSLAMPLGPRTVASVHNEPERRTMDTSWVEALNRMQEDVADEWLFRRPTGAPTA